jgi:iron(III) transport system permease protein
VRRSTWALGVGLALVLLALLLGVPLTALAWVATDEGLAGLRRALSGPAARTAIVHTLAISIAVTLLAVPVGAAAAMAVERRAPAERRAARLLIAAPLLIPEFVLGFAWTQAFGPGGLGDQVAGATIPGLYGPVGIVCVLTTHAIPLAYLAVAAGLALQADAGLVRAARSSGAGPATALRTITLPLLRVPLLAGAALVFVSAVNSFAAPRVLGAPAGFGTMSTLVYSDLVLSADPSAFTDLTVIALAMALLVMLALGPIDLWLGGFAAKRRRSGFGGAAPSRAATPTDRHVDLTIWTYTAFTVGLPMLALVLTALTRGQGLPPVPENWTLANFSAAFTGPAGAALARTIWLSAIAAALAPLLGGLVAGVSRRAWRGPVATLVTLAFAVPGSALAVGVLIGYGRWLPGSALLIVLAYLAKFWAFGHRPIQAALDRISPDLVLAARSSGADAAAALRTVILPPLTTALLGSAALIFLIASHELTMSSILYGPGSQTFAVVIANQRDLGGTGTTAALAIVLALPVLAAGGLVTAGRRLAR